MVQKIQLRRGTAAAWTAANPILAEGEICVELDTGQFKIGNGVTAWNSLTYANRQGDQGIQGETGPQGIQGIQGIQGEQGIPGVNGIQVLYADPVSPTPGTPWIRGDLVLIDNAPTFSSVTLSYTTLNIGDTVTMNLNGYDDIEGDLPGTHVKAWLADDIVIDGQTASTISIIEAYFGKTLKGRGTPVALTGTSPGSPVTSTGVLIPIPVPTGVSAEAGNAQATVSWDNNTGLSTETYNIKRSTTVNGTYSNVATGQTGSSYVDTTAINDTEYFYKVSIVVNSVEGTASSATSGVTPQAHQAPTAPVLSSTVVSGIGTLEATVQTGSTFYEGATLQHYIWEKSPDGVSNWTEDGTGASPHTYNGLTNGVTMYLRAKTVDNQGGVSAPSNVVSGTPALTWTKVESNDGTQITTFTGAYWTVSTNASYSGANSKYVDASQNPTANSHYAEFTFTGKGIRWGGLKGAGRGIAEVFIDNISQGTFDAYNASNVFQSTIFEKADLTNAQHTIQVVFTATKNASATSTAIDIDYWEVGT